VLRRAKITNANEEESYWSINASKLWLLPGSDWAVLNAVIKVGEIPVLYLPVLYYPSNEIIFHPVLGYRTREGTFVQTTTYLLGRPKAVTSTEESSISTIMGSGEGMEKTREGVFLRSTGRKVRDESETRLSFLADAYVNLGYYAGSELNIPARGNFGELLFSAGVGFSRDIALSNGIFTPFDVNGNSNWHGSRFFNAELPFRYRFVSTGSVDGEGTVVSYSTLSWSLPLYSDPYVDNDFMRRSEDSSLFSLIKQATRPDMIVSDSSISSYTWQLNGNLGFNTSGLTPYISELNINSAAMAVTFETKQTTTNPPASSLSYPPNRYFFYPDKFTLFSVAASIGGTPISLGNTTDRRGT
jgi:lipopolysaccharide assembly outer membrane protein LptD (OstA)